METALTNSPGTGDLDAAGDVHIEPSPTKTPLTIAGLIAAVVPFFVHITSSSSSTVDGVTTSSPSTTSPSRAAGPRSPAAPLSGDGALKRKSDKNEALLIAAALCAVGVFKPAARARDRPRRLSATPAPSVRLTAPMARGSGHCSSCLGPAQTPSENRLCKRACKASTSTLACAPRRAARP